jgi:hypothetical protein
MLTGKLQADRISKLAKITGIIIAASRTKAKATSVTLICKNCKSVKTVACRPGLGGAVMPRSCDHQTQVCVTRGSFISTQENVNTYTGVYVYFIFFILLNKSDGESAAAVDFASQGRSHVRWILLSWFLIRVNMSISRP